MKGEIVITSWNTENKKLSDLDFLNDDVDLGVAILNYCFEEGINSDDNLKNAVCHNGVFYAAWYEQDLEKVNKD